MCIVHVHCTGNIQTVRYALAMIATVLSEFALHVLCLMHIIITLHLCSFPLQDGETALDLAKRKRHFDTAKVLTDASHVVCTLTSTVCVHKYVLRNIARPSYLATQGF